MNNPELEMLDTLYSRIRSYTGTYQRGKEPMPPEVKRKFDKVVAYTKEKYGTDAFHTLGTAAMFELIVKIRDWKIDEAEAAAKERAAA